MDPLVGDSTPKFGFIVVRHVTDNATNTYWQECYLCIRRVYGDGPLIVIIDDHSKKEYLSMDVSFPLQNIHFIESELEPGRGELLPYYYYARYPWFPTAIIIHDSVFIQKRISPVLNARNTYRFLWNFDLDTHHQKEERIMIEALQNNVSLLQFHSRRHLWPYGCFGVMSIVSHPFLQMIDQYHELSRLIPLVQTRHDRCTLERVIACIFQFHHSYKNNSMFGNINRFCRWGVTMEEYKKKLSLRKRLPFVKVWTGR